MTRLQPYQRTEDARGQFVGLTRERWAEVNLVTTRAGEVRGNHYHASTREMFCILSGRVSIDVEDVRTGVKASFEANPGDLFVIEPYELHTFRTHADSSWLNLLSQALDPARPDFHRATP